MTTTKEAQLKAFVTEVGKLSDGTPIVIGWDFCKCGQHVSNCPCVGGPTEPPYVTKLRERDADLDARFAVKTSTSTGNGAGAAPADEVPLGTVKPVKPAKGPKLPTCRSCGKSVTDDDADRDDDGAWTCFTCQEASG